uniref:JmjC domain-containing protein n=1 Tax=Aplanochytrium stocchinoi TaxID=215587 RepID=A0A6S8DS88_9STRA
MEALLSKLREDTQWHWVKSTEIERLENPSALTFLRDYVAKNRPVILTGLPDVKRWSAMTEWKENDGIILSQGENEVRVNMTPSGFGDAVVDTEEHGEIFVKPHETKMQMSKFFRILSNPNEGVAYLSHQNDNLRLDFSNLMNQVGSQLDISHEAFGNEPEAVNLWIGDERSVSSMHKDFYENMYCVIRGEKVFHLLPPCVQPFLYEQEYQEAHYVYETKSESWKIELEEGSVPWSPIDPAVLIENADVYAIKYPLAGHLRELIITANVREGEVLYLPAMWYHRVTQSQLTVAVNYWHNMDFDFRWVYFSLLERMTALLGNLEGAEKEEAKERIEST